MSEPLMTPHPGSPLSLGLDGMVDTPTPEMQRSVEESIERQLKLRRGVDMILEDLHSIAQKRRALKPVTCVCGSKQVQLISWIDNVKYRCRECRLIFEPKDQNA